MSCAWPTLPECIATKRSASRFSRAHALSRGRGVISAGSTQLGITTIRSDRAPLATRRLLIVSPIDTILSARRRYDRTTWRSTPTASEPAELHGRLRKDVLADDDERHADPAGHRETDGADHRRIRHAKHDVRSPRDETMAEGRPQVREVVGGARRQPGAVVGRRSHPPNGDPVSGERARLLLVLVQDAGHHLDVIGVRQVFAEVGEQVRGRLDARPVVLVEHEQVPAGGMRRRHVPKANF